MSAIEHFDVTAFPADGPIRAFADANSPSSPNSPHPHTGKAIFPNDSILTNWMTFARQFSESEDCFLIGAILPVIAAVLARNVWVDFDGKKFPNVYALLAARPGFRKSTTIRAAETVAKRLLEANRFTSAITSEEALFEEYATESSGSPDKLLVVDEGNTLLANWSETSYGKIVAKRYLSLYDCRGWRQSFKKNRSAGDTCVREISTTSTSVILGATWNVSAFSGLEARDGMKRRFLHYVSEQLVRTIYTPPPFDGREFNNLILRFAPLAKMNGPIKLAGDALETWKRIQDDNRRRLHAVPTSLSLRDEILATMLAEEPSHTLKVAMIFAACEAAVHARTTYTPQFTSANLALANQHVLQCIEAGKQLEDIGQRQETRNLADTILAHVRTDFAGKAGEADDAIILTKTELTRTFASHPGRRNGLSPDDLYGRALPDLEHRGLCREYERSGKLVRYAFRREDPDIA